MFISSPASIKRGTANIGKESKGVIMICGMVVNAIPFIKKYTTLESPNEKATGTRKSNRTRKTIIKNQEFMLPTPTSFP
jgi:hypothetical protein